MNEPDAFIDQVRQPFGIGGHQISNLCLIKTSQKSGSLNSVNK